jgi:hypothetical protein
MDVLAIIKWTTIASNPNRIREVWQKKCSDQVHSQISVPLTYLPALTCARPRGATRKLFANFNTLASEQISTFRKVVEICPEWRPKKNDPKGKKQPMGKFRQVAAI